MTVPSLRPYQLTAVNGVRDAFSAGHRAVLLTSPVASGKTMMFSQIASGAHAKQKCVLILAHRRELIYQIGRALTAWEIPYGKLLGGDKYIPRQSIVVASVQTALKRIPKLKVPDLIIADECHRVTSNTAFGKIIKAFPQARVLGVSASPQRTDNTPMSDIFNILVHGPSVAQLVEEGWLPPPEVYAPVSPDLSGVHTRMGDYVTSELEKAMKPTITGHAVRHYQKIAPGKRAIVFCCSVVHAKNIAQDFNAAGYNAMHIDGDMYDSLRDAILADFEKGKIQILTTVDIANEGLDIPGIEVGILLRPTQSVVIHVQQCGRAMRAAHGKEKAIIIDAAGNCFRHGLPDEDRAWSLDGVAERKKAGDKPPSVRTCARCFCAHRPSPVCPKCGFVYPIASREVEQVDGDLQLVTDPKRINMDELLAEPARAKEYSFLLRKAREKGYKDAWAWHVVASKEAKRRMKRISGGGG